MPRTLFNDLFASLSLSPHPRRPYSPATCYGTPPPVYTEFAPPLVESSQEEEYILTPVEDIRGGMHDIDAFLSEHSSRSSTSFRRRESIAVIDDNDTFPPAKRTSPKADRASAPLQCPGAPIIPRKRLDDLSRSSTSSLRRSSVEATDDYDTFAPAKRTSPKDKRHSSPLQCPGAPIIPRRRLDKDVLAQIAAEQPALYQPRTPPRTPLTSRIQKPRGSHVERHVCLGTFDASLRICGGIFNDRPDLRERLSAMITLLQGCRAVAQTATDKTTMRRVFQLSQWLMCFNSETSAISRTASRRSSGTHRDAMLLESLKRTLLSKAEHIIQM